MKTKSVALAIVLVLVLVNMSGAASSTQYAVDWDQTSAGPAERHCRSTRHRNLDQLDLQPLHRLLVRNRITIPHLSARRPVRFLDAGKRPASILAGRFLIDSPGHPLLARTMGKAIRGHS
jgi:hypothetical protein